MSLEFIGVIKLFEKIIFLEIVAISKESLIHENFPIANNWSDNIYINLDHHKDITRVYTSTRTAFIHITMADIYVICCLSCLSLLFVAEAVGIQQLKNNLTRLTFDLITITYTQTYTWNCVCRWKIQIYICIHLHVYLLNPFLRVCTYIHIHAYISSSLT